MIKVDPAPIFERIARLRADVPETQEWWAAYTGHRLQGSAWEKRLERARQRGWIDARQLEEFMALTEVWEPLSRHPRALRPNDQHLPSKPLRAALGARAEAFPALALDRVTLWTADKLCIRELGLHPALVYGDEWWDPVA